MALVHFGEFVPEVGLQSVLRQMRSLAARSAMARLTDDQLLERFLNSRDEAAFEVLLWRHGPRVLGLCRRILRQTEDAEDAFQATFLILSRKARSIGKRESLGSWLYKVACRVACRKRALVARLPKLSPFALAVDSEAARVESRCDSAFCHLDEEINRLPTNYREPFILHYVQGLSIEQTARQLGMPPTTIANRLARARRRLRQRLAQRGVGFAQAGVLTHLLGQDSCASLSPVLIRDTVRAVAAYAAAPALGTITPALAALLKGVSMRSRRIHWLASLLVGLTVGGVLISRESGAVKESAIGAIYQAGGKAKTEDKEAEPKPGDPLRVNFTLPFKDALAKAKNERKLLFLKPIYGGMDKVGAADHRCGLW